MRTAADDVAARAEDGELDEQAGGEEDEDSHGLVRELAEADGVEDVGDVLEEEGPGGAVEGVHLLPAADVHGGQHRDEGEADDHEEKRLPDRRGRDEREHGAELEIEEGGADDAAHDDHGLQTDEAALVEVPLAHLAPAIVVGVGDDEAGEQEEEVDGEVTVVDELGEAVVVGVGLEGVEDDDHEGGDTAQTVEDLVVVLGGQIRGGLGHAQLAPASSLTMMRSQGAIVTFCLAAIVLPVRRSLPRW